MDITAYWLNKKLKRIKDGKCYYYYPYTRCEIDDTQTVYVDGKEYIRIEVTEEQWKALTEEDNKEYNSDRRAHNKDWTADTPKIQKIDDDEIDYWNDRAEDKSTHNHAYDVCDKIDIKTLINGLPVIEKNIYYLDRAGYSQAEIAEILKINQSTVSRKLDYLFCLIDSVRFDDGDRSHKEVMFEVAWEDYLRNRHMKNDMDVRAYMFQLKVGQTFLDTLYKWYCTPKELLRYTIRYMMVGGKETKEQLLSQVSTPAVEFYNNKFDGEPQWLQMLCLRIMRELERRVIIMQEPADSPFRNMEREIAKIARRRKMSYDFYVDEVLARKYAIRRNRYIATYARRIAAKSKDKNTKHALKQEIALLDAKRKKLEADLFAAIHRYRKDNSM